ncbi:hypothetical protein XANCAGTX0491_008292 [Xanthoria calcicola]
MERAPRVKQSDPYGAGQNWLKDRCSEGGGIPSLIDTMPKAPYKDRGSSTQSSTRSVKGPYRVSKKQSPHPSSFSTMSNKTYNTSGGSTAGKYVSERAVDEYRGGSQYQTHGSNGPKSYHSVQRPWSAPTILPSQKAPRREADARISPMMQRWATESARNQPWNGVAGYYTSSPGKK